MTACAMCGREMLRPEATANGTPLCHPDVGRDCYHLVTVYRYFVPGLGVWDGARGWTGDLRPNDASTSSDSASSTGTKGDS